MKEILHTASDMKDFTDKEVLQEFVRRLIDNGVNIETDAEGDFCFKDADGHDAFDFSFLEDGRFHRIGGYTKHGWQDEIDFKKYY